MKLSGIILTITGIAISMICTDSRHKVVVKVYER